MPKPAFIETAVDYQRRPGKAKIDRCSIYKLDATSVSCKSNGTVQGTVQEACGRMGQLARVGSQV